MNDTVNMYTLHIEQLDVGDVLKEFHYEEGEWLPVYVFHNIHFEVDETVRRSR